MKTLVNIGDRIWYRQRNVDERTRYGKVIGVDGHGLATVQLDGRIDKIQLDAISLPYYPLSKYVWGVLNRG